MKGYKTLTAREITKFRKLVYDYHRDFGRDLPWRRTDDPYKILVSEIMLQQTQVARVVQKYEEFIQSFPDIDALARASLRDVLAVWQGLGYNRRALSLKKLAETVCAHGGGEIPQDVRSLMRLPGIGNATAHAICAFAFNHPVVFIETNIRAVYIFHFFSGAAAVKDSELSPLVEQTLDRDNPRRWYNALMDYGVGLKKHHANPGRKSAHHKRQSPFEGSERQRRGAVLRTLVMNPAITISQLIREIPSDPKEVRHTIKQLEKEGLIVKRGKYFSIA